MRGFGGVCACSTALAGRCSGGAVPGLFVLVLNGGSGGGRLEEALLSILEAGGASVGAGAVARGCEIMVRPAEDAVFVMGWNENADPARRPRFLLLHSSCIFLVTLLLLLLLVLFLLLRSLLLVSL